jgi:hypothetical protein
MASNQVFYFSKLGVSNRLLVSFDRVLVRLRGVLVSLCGVLVSFLVVARLVMRCGFVMMFSCFLMVFGCFVVCFDCHGESSIWGVPRRASKHTANTPVDLLRRRFTVFT